MTTHTIRFSSQQLSILNNALVNMPYKDAAPLIAHINEEIQRNFDQKLDATSKLDQFSGD